MRRPMFRRMWNCRRCGRSWFVILNLRTSLNPPICNHAGTVKFGKCQDYPMYRTKRPGPAR